MSVPSHVTVAITVTSAGAQRLGFGTPLLLSNTAAWGERTRTYTTLTGVSADFAATSPEYLAAQVMFSQNPSPSKIKIGRAANAATKVINWIPVTTTDGVVHTLYVKGEGVTATTCSHTNSSDTVATIIDAMKILLDAVTGKNYTTTDNTTSLDIDGSAAGDWFSIEVGAANLQLGQSSVQETTTDPGVAADLVAIALEDDDWYGLVTWFNSAAYCLAATADMEARTKMYFPVLQDTDAISTAVTNGDYLDAIATATRARTAGWYHSDPSEFLDCAIVGARLSKDPGDATWKFAELSGITPPLLTATHKVNLRARNANFVETCAGKNITVEGTTADGDFIDTQRSIDKIEDDVSKSVFSGLVAADKIPLTDGGIATIEGLIKGPLQDNVIGSDGKGILAASPAPTVSVPLKSELSAADIAARTVSGITFEATLAGAVHKVTISGVVLL